VDLACTLNVGDQAATENVQEAAGAYRRIPPGRAVVRRHSRRWAPSGLRTEELCALLFADRSDDGQ